MIELFNGKEKVEELSEATHYKKRNAKPKRIPKVKIPFTLMNYKELLCFVKDFKPQISDMNLELTVMKKFTEKAKKHDVHNPFNYVDIFVGNSLPSPFLSFKDAKVWNMDALRFLRGIRNECIDLIITDPPYSSLEKHRFSGKALLKKWFSVVENTYFIPLLEEFYRILKPNTYMYIFVDEETMFVMKEIIDSTKFKFYKNLVWNKVHLGMGYNYRRQYEYIMLIKKGARQLNYNKYGDVLTFKRPIGRNLYPTEKPVDLLKILIHQSTKPSDIVLDPFMGSGSIIDACLQTKRRIIGCDISTESMGYIKTRFSQ